MFRADAMFANVAKHICVFEESCWWFHFKSLSRWLHTLKESIIIIKLAFRYEKFGRASGYGDHQIQSDNMNILCESKINFERDYNMFD